MKILVSACLLGVNCKYSGGSNETKKLLELMKQHTLIPVCPEQLGGMTTPRKPSEIVDGTGISVLEGGSLVRDNEGRDNTSNFIKGAEETLSIAKKYDIKFAVLKENSPSCGSSHIYDGTFSGRLIKGSGVTAALLEENGIRVYGEEKIEQLLKDLEEKIKSKGI